MQRPPPRSTRTDTLFPYTTLFRSQHQPLQTRSFGALEQLGVLAARLAKEGKRGFQVLRDQPALLPKALWRQVVGVAAVRHLADLHIAFVNRPLQQGVDEADGNADALLERDLRDHLAPLDSRQKIRSEEHTSELQSLMRISYAVF